MPATGLTKTWTTVALALACLQPMAVAGQTELVVDAGIGAFAAGDFLGTPAGPSLGASLHVAEDPDVQGGFQVGWARHDGEGVESATTQFEFLGLARYAVMSGPMRVYVGGKMGLGRRSLRIVGDPAAGDGFLIGPSAALRLPLGSLRVQLTFDALYETWEELVLYGLSEYGTDEDGLRLVFRAGLAFPLEGLGSGSDEP